MDYTSIENIHKVIDSQFLNEVKAELEEISKIPVERTHKQKLDAFQQKLTCLAFIKIKTRYLIKEMRHRHWGLGVSFRVSVLRSALFLCSIVLINY